MTNMLKKVFNWSEVHLSKMTCYKIHTLALGSWCSNKFDFGLSVLGTFSADFIGLAEVKSRPR